MQIIPPKNCPACQAPTELRAGILYCTGSSCTPQGYKQVEHFAKTMKIKGLGPATIQKLGITDPQDLYLLTDKDFEVLSPKISHNLKEELRNSCSQPLEVVIAALGIPLLGLATAKKLASVCESIEDITRTTCENAGIGPKATSNLLSFDFSRVITSPLNIRFSEVTVSTKPVVCITGRVKSFKTKAEASKALEAAGYRISPSVTKEVSILVNEEGTESSKTKKARESGIKIVSNIGDLI